MSTGHITSGRVFIRAGQEYFSLFGPISGLMRAHPKMTRAKKKEIMRPGISPAMKSFPMETCVMRPSRMSVTLGGMRTPRVPTVATMPVESFLL
ncbi:MAG: hypothetical protein A4E60_03351 [Syntrophorhabdus sp. PtaB.Bin047]|nr:MAG: hypothetical protein A4E60_03351 [Syntrophorhabdus sp. PtaB.Bin047]